VAIKSELTNDSEREPGYGLIRIFGISTSKEKLLYSLESNQGSQPFLGGDGTWQAQQTWHQVLSEDMVSAAEPVIFRVGPKIVDPLVEQPQHVMCRLTVDCNGSRQTAALKIQRPLLSSKAYAQSTPTSSTEKPPLPEPAGIPEMLADEMGLVDTQDLAKELDVNRNYRKSLYIVLLIVLLLVLLAIGVWLWWECHIPMFQGPQCKKTNAQVTTSPPSELIIPRNCSGLDGESCLSMATKAVESGRLDMARQLMQEAGNLGATKAFIHLAHMYDPTTWAIDKSPAEKVDWETAAYWYEEAARVGDSEGMLGAGRLYCENAMDAAFRLHGADLLRKALANDPSAAQALKKCEEKLKRKG